MNTKLKGYRWPIHKAIELIEHHYDVEALYPSDRKTIMVECGCGIATLNRAIKAVRVKRLLIQTELSVTDPEFLRYDKIYILRSTIDTLKGHVKYLYDLSFKIARNEKLDAYDKTRLEVIEKIGGVKPSDKDQE